MSCKGLLPVVKQPFLMQAMSKKILIVGAGTTGLALAGLLENQDVDVTLIEKSTHFSKVGYGITIMPEGMSVINTLGLAQQLKQLGTVAKRCIVTNENGKNLMKLG